MRGATAVRLGVFGIVALAMTLAAGGVVQAADDTPITISSVSASFFPNPTDSGAFISSPATAVTFTQEFPGINFNTPSGTVPCKPASGVGPTTRPFTNVVPQADGTCKTVIAQGNKLQAGVGDLTQFQAVFTGSFQVAAAGRVTFNMYSDDGWILSIGPSSGGVQPAYVSGPMLNFPRVGPFTGYTIVGSDNVETAANQNNLVVGFPGAGTFPFELDYSECCTGDLALTMMANGKPIPPTPGLAIDVRGLNDAARVQGKQHVDIVATSGQPQQVELLVDGASRQTVRTTPFGFDWDTTQETPGAHKVSFRAVDATGATANKELNVQVVATTAPANPTPAPVATPVTPPPARPFYENTTLLLIAAGAILLVTLVGAGVYFYFFYYRKRPKPAPKQAPAAVPVAPAEEKTEFIGKVAASDLTMVSNRVAQVAAPPKGKLLVKDREIPLSRTSQNMIGRDSTNAAYVDDRQVSRHHARIICVDGDFWIEDLNSTNGTRVNGATVDKQKLSDNDQIGVGDTIITFALERT
jgi:hypothetical protein